MGNNLITSLNDLSQRLILDYNDDKKFQQQEEDRTAVLNAIEIITITSNFVNKELKTYLKNATLERISRYLEGTFDDERDEW